MGRLKTRLLLTLAIMGVMFTGFGISSISFDGKKAKDFATASSYQLTKNAKFEGVIDTCLGNYAYETDDDSTTEYYLVPLPSSMNKSDDPADWYYVSFSTGNHSHPITMDRIIDYTYGDSSTYVTLPFTGQVKDLDSEIEGYLYEAIIEADLFGTDNMSEIKQHISPYCIEYRATGFGGVLLVIGLVCLGILAAIFIPVIRRGEMQMPFRPAGGFRHTGEAMDMPMSGGTAQPYNMNASPSYTQPQNMSGTTPSYAQPQSMSGTTPSYAQPQSMSGTTSSYAQPQSMNNTPSYAQPQSMNNTPSYAQPQSMNSTPSYAQPQTASVKPAAPKGFEEPSAGVGIMDELDTSSLSFDDYDDLDQKL